jgi:hypothetical protein
MDTNSTNKYTDDKYQLSVFLVTLNETTSIEFSLSQLK